MKLTKFRVWDGSQLHEVSSIQFNENYPGGFSFVTVPEGDSVKTLFQALSDAILHIEGHYNLELLQYVGLNDKNDKRIYEGYVVKFTNEIDEIYDEQVGIVVFDEQEKGYQIQYKTKENNEFTGEYTRTNVVYLIDDKTTSYEVIGNIYENPELTGGLNNGE